MSGATGEPLDRRVRLRGIYATALTRLFLDAGATVVQASAPIERRFEETLGDGNHDLRVRTTDDRQGVGVSGDEAGVAAALEPLRGVGLDAFAWTDRTPPGAVFDGRVRATRGVGAVVDLGGDEGYLPFDRSDDYLDEGDAVRVQVAEAAPPWSDDRPLLDAEIRADGGMATLVAGRSGTTVDGRGGAARELAGLTDLLDVDVPDGWGVVWEADATDASMDDLAAALSRAGDRAAELEAPLEGDVGDPGRLAAPLAGAWVWFGRDSRFALDHLRRKVTPTMPGHHRTKAASNAASAGVDLSEALCEPSADAEFPFAVVADQFGPNVGDSVRIGHGKPSGRRIVLGTGEVVERDGDAVTVRREMTGGGTYDALGVEREAGDVATTSFREGRWWYPTTYRSESDRVKGTYVNVCTPVECFPDEIRYVDLHVDVVKHPDGTVRRVDDDELDEAVADGDVNERLAERAREVASAIESAL